MNLILQAPVAICIFKGPEMLLDIANERMIEFFGRSAEELLKKPIFEALPEARNQGFEELLVNVMQTGNPVSASESPVTLHRNGELQEVFVNFVYAPVRENDGSINSIIALAIDVTEQVHARHKIEEIVDQRTKELALVNEDLIQLNKELKRSNANLEEFAYAASHDLKEPVRKIHLFTSQLREQLNTLITAEQAKYFNRIENSTVRMKNLIDDLLLYSHVTFQPDIKEDVDLNEKADRVIEDLDLEIEEKAARIKIEKLPVVRGYPRQLQQMFQNLISNSLKYSKSDEQPRVDISAREVLVDGINYHLIAIKDNGIGFEAEYFDTIFHIFTRLHRQTQYSGTGVGLSIVKKVVENHNGFIRVESTPGTGSTFNIYLLKNTKD